MVWLYRVAGPDGRSGMLWGNGDNLFPFEKAASLDVLLHLRVEQLRALIERVPRPPAVAQPMKTIKPVESQEVWAAGLTYRRSRDARVEETTTPDPYDRAYAAERPELFFKATASRVRGPGEAIRIRTDSTWDVPEPELAVVCNSSGEIVGYTIGNDVSSRSIEGENPLYLPQAKIYDGSCALGPAIRVAWEFDPGDAAIELEIRRAGELAFCGRTSTGAMCRRIPDLIAFLCRDNHFEHGMILLTGTGIVPPDDFTLKAGDEVVIRIEGLGELRNPVERAG